MQSLASHGSTSLRSKAALAALVAQQGVAADGPALRAVPPLNTGVSCQMNLDRQIAAFAQLVGSGAIEIYNEFSLQHELGLFLRGDLPNCRVQFERNVSHFKLVKTSFEKREIDISVTAVTSGERLSAIELKYPRNGQVPESMFGFCKDIAFLEQLVSSGFQSAYFLAVADDPLFYSGNSDGIYGLFRGGKPITGTITKPTGAKDSQVTIRGSYKAKWLPISAKTMFCLVQVGS